MSDNRDRGAALPIVGFISEHPMVSAEAGTGHREHLSTIRTGLAAELLTGALRLRLEGRCARL